MDNILIGQILKPQGIKGEVKIKVYEINECDLRKNMALYIDENKEEMKLLDFSLRQGFLYAKFENIYTVEDANKLRNKNLYIAKSDIKNFKEDNDFFVEELLGFEVILSDGKKIGILDDVQNFGSADIFYVNTENNSQILFPNVREIIEGIDLTKKIITLQKKVFDEVAVI